MPTRHQVARYLADLEALIGSDACDSYRDIYESHLAKEKLFYKDMTLISKPGIYPNCTAAEYHADPCETPSLSSTIAKKLISLSPKHAWLAHARLGGLKDEDDDTADPKASKAKALGELIHRLMLGKGGDIVVINEDSYRTGSAKAQRDAALADGKIPVLAHKLPEAETAVAEARKQLDAMGYDFVFRDGMKEVVLVWEESGIWLRAMVDQLLIDENTTTALIPDLKTVGRSSHPEACASQIDKLGYDLSLAFYMRGLKALRPDLAGRIKSWWAFMETTAPYAVTPVEISAEWQMAAEVKCDRAIAIWRKCIAENRWPYYVDKLTRLEPKPWVVANAFGGDDL